MDTTQNTLLRIVKSWDIQSQPEYRDFRCGRCQKFLHKSAWHYFLHTGGYISPLHFCDECKENLEKNTFSTSSPASHEKINPQYSTSSIAAFEKIVNSWDLHQKPVKKEFQCDHCGMSLVSDQNKAQGHHVWWRRNDDTLVELHFDKECGKKLLV